MDSLKDRFRGCLLGLAVGDAVGTTLEFKPTAALHRLRTWLVAGPSGWNPASGLMTPR
jgi:ADP-ribosyl-[dinitrogen reductase] hydrolase